MLRTKAENHFNELLTVFVFVFCFCFLLLLCVVVVGVGFVVGVGVVGLSRRGGGEKPRLVMEIG